jgi:hypothetical protein
MMQFLLRRSIFTLTVCVSRFCFDLMIQKKTFPIGGVKFKVLSTRFRFIFIELRNKIRLDESRGQSGE